jgi:hypothetical protein
MALLGVIHRFATPGSAAGRYTVQRPAAGTYVVGAYIPAAPTTFPIEASVQPMAGRTSVVLPEGVSIEDTREVWTATRLQPGTQSSDADIVLLPSEQGDEPFWVFAVEGPWQMSGETHYRAQVARRRKR